MSSEYDLTKSKKALGSLVPVLEDAHGNVIDGFHRLQIDPKWPAIKLGHVTDKLQLTIARLVANVCRREMTNEEKTLLLTEIAEATGWRAMEIANATGMSYRWVAKYLPDKYKDPEMQARAELAARHTAQDNSKEELKSIINEIKPKETWEHRQALMHPQHSKMEQSLLLKLQEHGLNPVVDYEFWITKTVPDYYFVDKRLAIYIDGPVHEGHEERDDYLREQLSKKHGIRVVSIAYETNSKTEVEEVFGKIVEAYESG